MANYVRNNVNYHGRSKTSSGQPDSKKKGSGRNQRNSSNNTRSDVDYNVSERRKYTTDDLWATLPSESSVPENAWDKGAPGKNKSYSNKGHRTVDQAFFWGDSTERPANNQPPVENVWEKRKEKLETIKAMEPASQTEEERMIQKAIQLSQLEALEKEEKRKKLEEEYELQQLMLKTNPTFFVEFQTTDELNAVAATKDFLDQEILETLFDDFALNSKEKSFDNEIIDECKENFEDYKSEKENKQPYKSINEVQFSKCEEYQEGSEENWSQSLKNKKYINKNEKDYSQHCNEDLDLPSDKFDSISCSNNKASQGALPKISKVIDMFGGWGSKSSQTGNFKSSQEQNNSEPCPFSNSDEVVSNNEKSTLKDFKELKNISSEKKFEKNSRDSKTGNLVLKKKDDYVVSNKKNFSDNATHLNVIDEDGSVPKSENPSFSKMVEISSKTDEEIFNSLDNKKISRKHTHKLTVKDDGVNSNIQDCTDLALGNSGSFIKENNPANERAEKAANATSKCSILTIQNNAIHKNVSEDFQKTSKYLLSPTNYSLVNENDPSDLNQSNINKDVSANETTSDGRYITYSLNDIPLSSKNNITENFHDISHNEKIQATLPRNNIYSDVDKKGHMINETVSFGDLSSGVLPNNLVTNANSDPLPLDSNQIKDNLSLSFSKDSTVTSIAESNFIDPPIPAPTQPEPCQPDTTTGNLMNPLIMQQMMMLSNPFFLQQLQQMNMYYQTMCGMPFATGSPIMPLSIPPFVNVQFPPIFNKPLENIPSSDVHNANLVPQQDARMYSPSHERFESCSLNSQPEMMLRNSSKESTVKFEESWLSDIMSEGAAYANMDSYIPPPKMPEDNPIATSYLSTFEENKVDFHVSQCSSQSVNKNGIQAFNCDIENSKGQSTIVDNYQQWEKEDENGEWSVLDKKETDVSDEHLATGWGNIEDEPKNNYSSWDDGMDGWGSTATQPMMNSTRYVSEKSETIRQPSRQPFVKTYQRRGVKWWGLCQILKKDFAMDFLSPDDWILIEKKITWQICGVR
ncbi:uncharacterized protein NPIL_355561 [Nephila pilipes]|uniref:Uncharacterized protein n=1 Tax=Nephila pilipes TaxID=299642 RepID=A0A8X6UPD1_NEPPI|nr:uncharacterized protein NPIL_355561 [Nephila pilipes]